MNAHRSPHFRHDSDRTSASRALDRRLERAKSHLLAHRDSWDATPDSPLRRLVLQEWTIPNELRDAIESVGYELLELIGRGATSLVVRARHKPHAENVAIKLVYPTHASPERSRARISRIESLADLSHPNLVGVRSARQLPNGWWMIVMDFVDGETLAQRLKRCGSLPVDEAIRVMSQAAAGLTALHENGFCHRDIKPSNLLIDLQSGAVRLADFGLARQFDRGATLTADGYGPGTPAYMAPEQFSVREFDRRLADVYSLGAVLYECVFGEPPFSGPLPALIYQILHESPQRLSHGPSLPPALKRVLWRSLDKRPGKRYPSARAMLDALKRCPRDGQHGNFPSHWLRLASRSARAAGGILALILLAVSVGHQSPRSLGGASSYPSPLQALQGGAVRQSSEQTAAAANAGAALQWALYQPQVSDPRPTAQREAAARAMLHILDSMGTAARQNSPTPEITEAGMLLSKAKLLLQIDETRTAQTSAIRAASVLDAVLRQEGPDSARGGTQSKVRARDLLEMAVRAHRLSAEALLEDERVVAARWHVRRAKQLVMRWRSIDEDSLTGRLEHARVALVASQCTPAADAISAVTDLQLATDLLDELPAPGAAKQPEYAHNIAACFVKLAQRWEAATVLDAAASAYGAAEEWYGRYWPSDFEPGARYEYAQFYFQWAEFLNRAGQIGIAQEKLALATAAVSDLIRHDGDYPEYRQLQQSIDALVESSSNRELRGVR